MTQRTLAGIIAAPLVIALLLVAWLAPLPYVVYRPGLTLDVLATVQGKPIVEVEGRKTYPTGDGQLRMTTVSVTQPEADLDLFSLLQAWASPTAAVYPYDAVYQKDTTAEQSKTEGAVQMVSSQDTATAVALKELGVPVREAVEVVSVAPGTPADGELKPRDLITSVDGTPVTGIQAAIDLIGRTRRGQSVTIAVHRAGKDVTVSLTPAWKDGKPRVGVTLAPGFDFPFQVDLNVDPAIGGPSAGLMFSLAVYDTLTPGELTGGHEVAGTGEIAPDGKVGPIGGIQQKIAGANRDGAQLFFVPPDNCADALRAHRGDVRLVRADTMHSAVTSLKKWVKDPDADLPSCQSKD